MDGKRTAEKDVDSYIKEFPEETQKVLQKLRKTIHAAVPNLTETISYQIPTFKMNGKYLVYFAGYKTHVGLYPFKDIPQEVQELEKYKSGAATLKFPLEEPLPFDLIKQLVQMKAEQK